MHDTDPDYANFPSNQPVIMDSTDSYLYQPTSQESPQPLSQDSSFFVTCPVDHTSIRLDVNEPLHYGVNDATMSDDLNNCDSPLIYYQAPQTSVQTQSTSTFSNNASMITIATSHGQVVLIMNGDIDLERFLFIIQSFVRVERIYR